MGSCKKCNKTISDQSTFCPYCGNSVEKQSNNGKSLLGMILGILSILIILIIIFLQFIIPKNSDSNLERSLTQSSVSSSQSSVSYQATTAPSSPLLESRSIELFAVYDTYKDLKDPFLNVRVGPGTSYSVVKKLKDGEVVEVMETGKGTDGKWFKVYHRLSKTTGFVHSRYLKRTHL